MTTVTVSLRTRERTELADDEWGAPLDALLARGGAFLGNLPARVRIRAPGQPEIVLGDELEPMVRDLCLLGPLDLLEGRPHVVRYWDQPGQARLTPEGPMVRVEGDYLATGVFPAAELVPALKGAARRVIDLLARLEPLRPEGHGGEVGRFQALYDRLDRAQPDAPAAP